MSTIELIAWTSLGVGFAGAWGIFATGPVLRRTGSMAMRAGLGVFLFLALQIALWPKLSGNPALPILWIPAAVAIILMVNWATRFFYRDLVLHGVEDRYSTDSEEIASR